MREKVSSGFNPRCKRREKLSYWMGNCEKGGKCLFFYTGTISLLYVVCMFVFIGDDCVSVACGS